MKFVIRYRSPGESDDLGPILSAHARLIGRFSPYYAREKVFSEDPYAHVGLPFLSQELFSRKLPGPYLEIYEMTR